VAPTKKKENITIIKIKINVTTKIYFILLRNEEFSGFMLIPN
jgi:hypothetical protein